jgi:hypothetical protein
MIDRVISLIRRQYTRGATIPVTVKFVDASRDIENPISANVTLSYVQNGCRTKQTYALMQSDDDWTYNWDSSVADRGRVYAHVATNDDAAGDFDFQLTSNTANQELFGDE